MAGAPFQVDMSKAEPVDEWKADPDPARIQIVITDGGHKVVMRLELNITGVQRLGNNPVTGEPIYNIGSTNVVKLLQWDRALKVAPKPKDPPGRAYG
ncbi:MAG: hypothetical protein L3J96_01185 [Thermoplasmata archaeon]|nr:hypothetical protein [Thermoplasmata archaeon]